MQTIKTFKQFQGNIGVKNQLRKLIRDNYIHINQLSKNINDTNNWVRFPLYHHVFDDERQGFERQIKYLKSFGDFVSMDDAAQLIDGKKINGRYFCITFDDGFECCYDNMMDITVSLDVPAIIYLVSDWMDRDINNEQDQELLKQIMPNNSHIPTFLTTQQCKEMLKNKISFGAHTCSHVNLGKISEQEIEHQLKESKKVIEEKLAIDCKHFAVPWGKVDIDYPLTTTEHIAKQLGYQTVTSTNRGKNIAGDNLFAIKRDHVLANWANYQLKYFFSL